MTSHTKSRESVTGICHRGVGGYVHRHPKMEFELVLTRLEPFLQMPPREVHMERAHASRLTYNAV